MYLVSRTYPAHDSANILLVRSANYHKHVEHVREWYSTQHHNWVQVDGERSQWWVGDGTRNIALTSARQIQHYLARITSGLCILCMFSMVSHMYNIAGHAAALFGLCITPSEFEAHIGEFSHYCPINLAKSMLVDCSQDVTLQFAAEFRHVMSIIVFTCTFAKSKLLLLGLRFEPNCSLYIMSCSNRCCLA